MLNLKKTAVAVLALGSSAVFAGSMGAVCTPGSVTVPCERTAWDFGGRALYLQQVGHDYAASSTVGTSTYYNDYNNDWGWGFQLEGSYHFSTGNDVNVNWYHWSRSTDNTFGPAVAGGPVRTFSTEPKWDAVNFEFGQHVDFGERKDIRFHGGAQYVRLEHNLDTFNLIGTGVTGYHQSKFNGFGPRIGMDMSYDLANGFRIYGNGATALLLGDSKFSNSRTPVSTVVGNFSSGSRTIMVPEIEAKLGVMYTYAMAQGDLTLDLGYMWVDYIDAHHNNGGPLSVFPVNATNNHFALDGIIFGAKWVGNVI